MKGMAADAKIIIDPQRRPGFINVLEDNSVVGASAKTTLYDTQVPPPFPSSPVPLSRRGHLLSSSYNMR